MALLRTGSTRIRTGASRVMQRQPPQRVPTTTRRAAPQKEIAFITESKKLEEARKESTPKVADINTLVQEVKDTGLSGAEAGYAINKAITSVYGKERDKVRKEASKIPAGIQGPQAWQRREEEQKALKEWRGGIFSGLKSELKSWADDSLAEYYKVMQKADAEYKEELENIKEVQGTAKGSCTARVPGAGANITDGVCHYT